MAVRNFYIEALIDGRETKLEGGPRNKVGGFSATVKIRDHGGIAHAVRLDGFARDDGTLSIRVSPGSGVTVKPDEDGGFTIEAAR